MTELGAGEVFTRIARHYDLVNRVLSLGRDQVWRSAVVDHLPGGELLDLGAGTGVANRIFGSRRVTALDPSSGMLVRNGATRRVTAVGEVLPFENSSFDAVFSAYVFRNLDSIPGTLGEISRVLRPGGRCGIVDLGRPNSTFQRSLHRAGTAVILPAVGLLGGAPRAYWYLHRTLDRLPPPADLYGEGPLSLMAVWRMGAMGFVYGAVLAKPG